MQDKDALVLTPHLLPIVELKERGREGFAAIAAAKALGLIRKALDLLGAVLLPKT
jgi:hypothetical protein